jgi:hypothetical protein
LFDTASFAAPQPIELPAVALGGSTLFDRPGGLGRKTPRVRELFPSLLRLGRFFVKESRLGGGAAALRQGAYLDLLLEIADPNSHPLSGAQRTRNLDSLSAHQNSSRLDRLLRKPSGLEEPRSPQPLVKPH